MSDDKTAQFRQLVLADEKEKEPIYLEVAGKRYTTEGLAEELIAKTADLAFADLIQRLKARYIEPDYESDFVEKVVSVGGLKARLRIYDVGEGVKISVGINGFDRPFYGLGETEEAAYEELIKSIKRSAENLRSCCSTLKGGKV